METRLKSVLLACRLSRAETELLESARVLSVDDLLRMGEEGLASVAGVPRPLAARIRIVAAKPMEERLTTTQVTFNGVNARDQAKVTVMGSVLSSQVNNTTSLVVGEQERQFVQEMACLDGMESMLEVQFLDCMREAARAVCAIYNTRTQRVVGTGFLLSGEGGWVVTNMHVIQEDYKKDAANWKERAVGKDGGFESSLRNFVSDHVCWFDYDTKSKNDASQVQLARVEEWIVLPHLDVVFMKPITIQEHIRRGLSVVAKLSPLVDKGKRCFIIGHPVFSANGTVMREHKMISMQRNNAIFKVVDNAFVRYFTDTHGGNSGSPVLVWDSESLEIFVAAVHHTGVPFDKPNGQGCIGYNEGTLMECVMEEPIVRNKVFGQRLGS